MTDESHLSEQQMKEVLALLEGYLEHGQRIALTSTTTPDMHAAYFVLTLLIAVRSDRKALTSIFREMLDGEFNVGPAFRTFVENLEGVKVGERDE